MIYYIDGLPQAGYDWQRQRQNATTWKNSWRQNTTQQQHNWQRNIQTIGNRNYTNTNNIHNNWQPQGERPWLNNNQSHPHIHVPRFKRNPQDPQSNRTISERTGWQQPQPVAPYLRNWAPQWRNSTQNISSRPKPFRNDGGGQFSAANSDWVPPGNPTNYTNWKSGVRNSTGNGNSRFPAQDHAVNSYPNWHAGLPGNTLKTGTYTGNSLPLSSSGQQRWHTPERVSNVNGSNSGPKLAQLVGNGSVHQNTPNAGWNLPSGLPNGAYSTHPYRKLFA